MLTFCSMSCLLASTSVNSCFALLTELISFPNCSFMNETTLWWIALEWSQLAAILNIQWSYYYQPMNEDHIFRCKWGCWRYANATCEIDILVKTNEQTNTPKHEHKYMTSIYIPFNIRYWNRNYLLKYFCRNKYRELL